MFQKKTVATVIAGFNKVCDDLTEVSIRNFERADAIEGELSQLEVEQGQAISEASRATTIRDNILKMVEG